MPYITTINGRTYTISPEENGQQRKITLNGREVTLDWRQLASLATDAKSHSSQGGHYSLLIAGKSYQVFARSVTKAGEKGCQFYEIEVAGQRFEVKVEDERTRKLAGLARGSAHAGEAIVQAPMPGLVIGILVEVGAQVRPGQTVAVLEAMKMENDLASPISGTITEIYVSQGQTVDQGQVLVVVKSAH